MNSTLAEDIMADLQSFYGRNLNKTAVSFYTACLSALDEKDLTTAWIALKQKERQFPTVDKIKEYCSEARDRRYREEKAFAPAWRDLEKCGVTANGAEAIQMMKDLYDHKLSRVEYLAKMFEMDEKYPGVGWLKNGRELKRFWAIEQERHKQGAEILANMRKGRPLSETE